MFNLILIVSPGTEPSDASLSTTNPKENSVDNPYLTGPKYEDNKRQYCLNYCSIEC